MTSTVSSSWRFWVPVLSFHLAAPFLLLRFHHLIPDEDAYINLAVNLATNASFHLDFSSYWHAPGQPYTHVAPGWPALLSLGYLVIGGTLGCWLILGLVWCANALLVYQLGRVLKLSEIWCRILVLWLTLNPLLLFYHGHLMTEALTITCCLASMILSLQFLERPGAGIVLALGIVTALGHLVRTQTLLPMFAIGVVALLVLPWRMFLGYSCLFVLVHVLVLAPWLWRMEQAGAGFTSTELKLGINLFQFGGSAVDNPYDQEGTSDLGLPPEIESMSPYNRNKILTRYALQGIVNHPGRYLSRCLARFRFLFSPTPNFYQVSPLQYWVVTVSSLAFYYVPLLAVAARAFRPVRLRREEWVLLLTLGFWYVFHILINASIRNRLPSDVFCAALALSFWVRPGEQRVLSTGSGTDGMITIPPDKHALTESCRTNGKMTA